ncbi:MAG: hypothetical protein HUU37_09500, partial [Bdellovibrionales bacterium]|nr:hypothetical protein [Bdellovibrionales bacterium]
MQLSPTHQALWDLRNAGAVDSALAGWLAWCGELGLPSDAPVSLQAEVLERRGLPAEEILRFSLLGMSFLRNARRLDEMRSRTEAITAWARARNLTQSFTLSLQLGLNAMAEGNLASALENFTEARRRATDKKSLLFALLNSTICCEDLGLDFSRPLAEFENAFRGSEKEPWAQSLLGQLEALRLRQAFKEGDGATLAKLLAGPLAAEQAHYYAAWLASLPTFSLGANGSALRESFLDRVERNGFTYLSGFRLRTLNFLLVREDLDPSIRAGEKIERLYLWV